MWIHESTGISIHSVPDLSPFDSLVLSERCEILAFVLVVVQHTYWWFYWESSRAPSWLPMFAKFGTEFGTGQHLTTTTATEQDTLILYPKKGFSSKLHVHMHSHNITILVSFPDYLCRGEKQSSGRALCFDHVKQSLISH